MPVEALKTSAASNPTTSTRGFDKCLQEIQMNIQSKEASKNTSEITKSNKTIITTTAASSVVNKGLATPLKRAILARRKSLSADAAPKAITTTTPAKLAQAGATSTPAPLFNNYSNNGINQHFRSINTPLRQAILKRRKSINERAPTPVESIGTSEPMSVTCAPKPTSAKRNEGVDVPMTVRRVDIYMRVEAMKSNLIVALQKHQQLTVPVNTVNKPTVTIPVALIPTIAASPEVSASVMISAEDAVTGAVPEEMEVHAEQEATISAEVAEEPASVDLETVHVPKQQRLCTLVASKLNLLMSKRRAVFKNFGCKIHFHTYRAGGNAVKALRKTKAAPVATASDAEADMLVEGIEEEEASVVPLSVEGQEECEAQQEAVIAATCAQLAVDAFASELELNQVCITLYSAPSHVHADIELHTCMYIGCRCRVCL